MIRFIDLNKCNERYAPAINKVLKSGQYINGQEVELFEQAIAKYLGSKYSIAVNSGTDALVIALEALEIGSGDEVITTPFTFVATVEAIKRVGATPVYVDIDPGTYNIDTSQILQQINARTKAVLAVNLFGNPCDVFNISEICKQHNLRFILDSAQAFGAKANGEHLNSFADVTTLSFFPTKILGGLGDSGMLVTDNDLVFEKARRLRNHGSCDKLNYIEVGYNSRMDEIQAAVLREKLENITYVLETRNSQAEHYKLLLPTEIMTQSVKSTDQHAWNVYTIKVKQDRNRFKQYLLGEGVETRIYYPTPINCMPPYRDGTECPEAKRACNSVLSLPIGAHLERRDVEMICAKIKAWNNSSH